MRIYLLTANGTPLSFQNSVRTTLCRQWFRTKEQAENYIPEFRKTCIGKGVDLLDLDPKELYIHVIELEEHVSVPMMSKCAKCGKPGYCYNTRDGRTVELGETPAKIPEGSTILCVGQACGPCDYIGKWLCDDCDR